jgi:hypothetical protein
MTLTPINEMLLNLCLDHQECFPNTDSPEEIEATLNQVLDKVYESNSDEEPNLVKSLTNGILDHCMEAIDSYDIAQAYYDYVTTAEES